MPSSLHRPRRLARPLIAVSVMVAGLLATSNVHATPAGAIQPLVGYQCAVVPTRTPRAGVVVIATTTLGATRVTYRATVTKASGVTTPDYGAPYPGTLTVSAPRHVWTLPRPGGFAGSVVIQLCLVSGDRGPTVLLGTYSGGAHCCVETALYARSGGHYRIVLAANLKSMHPTIYYDPNQGLVAKVVGSSTVLESADGTFAYRFGCYACTPTPLVLYQVSGTRLVNVTTRFPQLERAAASTLWRAVLSNETPASGYQGLFGVLAAWTAEECTLGRGATAWGRVLALQRRGLLTNAHYHAVAFVTSGSYVPTLKKFLNGRGYCRGAL